MNVTRSGFVEFQQRLARTALARGQVGAARAALRVLRTADFVGGAGASEGHLAVLRDQRSTDEELREAIGALLALPPAGQPA